MTPLCYYTNADCIEDSKQINNNLQHLQIMGTLWCSTKALLSGLDRQGKCEGFFLLWNLSQTFFSLHNI
jgi:hypothetical protein